MQRIMQPVVAIVGHIDHGKTTLLDYIRKSAVAAREVGGITQRVSAYEIIHTTDTGPHPITFIDTPGHEAFKAMRARSARAADIAILIVAADDGVKPQTVEAIKAITDAGVPYIVAFTKVDKDTANLDRAKESVIREGVYLEGLGGDVPWVAVSGKTGAGVSELLDTIQLLAEVGGMYVDATLPAKAIVVESERNPKTGVSAMVIIRQGTITTGGFAVSGSAMAPLRIIEDYAGNKVASLRAGQPARIVGFNTEPAVGSEVVVVATKKEAEALTTVPAGRKNNEAQDMSKPLYRVVLKADSQGTLEALQYELAKVSQEKVAMLVVDANVGPISDNDVKLLIGFTPAAILGFNVKADASARDLAERQHLVIETRQIIYELAEWLTTELAKC